MEKFVKENWFKAIISLVLIIIAFSVAYYFVIYLPTKDKEFGNEQTLKSDQENAEKCATAGQKYFDANFSEYKNAGSQVNLDGPYFHFNKKLQSCLLEYKLMLFEKKYPNPIDYVGADYHHTDYILNLTSGGTEASVVYFWRNGKFLDDHDQVESMRFDNLERDIMQN